MFRLSWALLCSSLLLTFANMISLNDRAYASLSGVSIENLPRLPQRYEHSISKTHTQYARFPEKLKFAIYQFEVLEKKLERAERNIKQLAELSCLLHDNMRCDGKLTSNNHLDIRRLEERHRNIEKSKAFFRELHSARFSISRGFLTSDRFVTVSHRIPTHRSSQSVELDQWGLELKPPESPDVVTAHESRKACDVDFTVRTRDHDRQAYNARRCRIQRSFPPAEMTGMLPRVVCASTWPIPLDLTLQVGSHATLVDLPEPQSRSMNLKHYLLNLGAAAAQINVSGLEPTISEQAIRDMFAENLVSEARADVAFGLAYWLLLTWSSPWLMDVCSCGLRSVTDRLDAVHHAFWSEPHTEQDCYDGPQGCGRLFRLGVVLVELALVRPLVVLSRFALRFRGVSHKLGL